MKGTSMGIYHPREDPPDDPELCETCDHELEVDVDGDRDEDGQVYAVYSVWCPNERCVESPDYIDPEEDEQAELANERQVYEGR